MNSAAPYRGRLAPSPTGLLHLGHAQTFWIARQRARAARGQLILRLEDLDASRSKKEFVDALIEDLRWLGIDWDEGPFFQSERLPLYQSAFAALQNSGLIYPCRCSRRDVAHAAHAPHIEGEEPIYPGTCRPPPGAKPSLPAQPANWRFRVPDGETIAFVDNNLGGQSFVAGRDFGDFVVWTPQGPSYQLAVVADDIEMRVTEVVRGADLLVSTARQLLLYRALGATPPAFFHCPLVTNAAGVRLAKRDDALSLRALRTQGKTPVELKSAFACR